MKQLTIRLDVAILVVATAALSAYLIGSTSSDEPKKVVELVSCAPEESKDPAHDGADPPPPTKAAHIHTEGAGEGGAARDVHKRYVRGIGILF